MEAAVQAPIPLLEEYSTLSPYHVCRADLVLSSSTYANFYSGKRKLGDYVVLDSSDSEPRKSIKEASLLEAIELVRPSLIVAPDLDLNASKTIRLTRDFLEAYRKKLRVLDIEVLGMLQGVGPEQCLYCYRNIYRWVDAIGLPRSLEVGTGRAKLLSRIRSSKPIHIFGVHSNPEEEIETLLDLDGYNLSGISTDLPFRLGLICKFLDEARPEPPALDYFSGSDPYPEVTRANIKDFIEMAGG